MHFFVQVINFKIVLKAFSLHLTSILAASGIAHPLPNCRLYYSEVTVEPQKSIDYVQRNRNKKVIYRSFVTNSYKNITVGSLFNALVNSEIVHPTADLNCPYPCSCK